MRKPSSSNLQNLNLPWGRVRVSFADVRFFLKIEKDHETKDEKMHITKEKLLQIRSESNRLFNYVLENAEKQYSNHMTSRNTRNTSAPVFFSAALGSRNGNSDRENYVHLYANTFFFSIQCKQCYI